MPNVRRADREKLASLEALRGPISSQKGPVYFLFIDGPCLGDCIFCSHKQDSVISLEKIQSRLDRTCEGGIICLIGNEPLLHPQILEIISACRRQGFAEIEIMTSGLHLKDSELTGKLVDLGVRSFSIPLHAPSGALHDGITMVNGSFSAVVRGIKNAIQSGAEVYVHTTLIRQNAFIIPDLADFVKHKLGAHFAVFPLRPKSSGKTFAELGVSFQDARSLASYGFCGFPRCVAFEDTGMPSKSMKAYFECQSMDIHDKCLSCSQKKYCPGFFMEQLVLFGGNEIKPISS